MEDSVRQIIDAVLRAADPRPAVGATLGAIDDQRRCWALLSLGKAASPMAEAALGSWGTRIGRGIGICARSHERPAGVPEREGLRWFAADHPLPSRENVLAASHVHAFVEGLGADDGLLLLLSGGASAMSCLPRPPLGLDDLNAMTDALLRSGARIPEINAVRKHCEHLKGGGLARACGAGCIISLILSDVLGDPLDVIGSGPTAPDPTTYADALAVLERRNLLGAVPAVTAHLRRGLAGGEPETAKPDDPLWARVENIIIGGNRDAIDAACEQATQCGYAVSQRRELVEAEAAEAGRALARAAVALRATSRRPACIVWGGETTVAVGQARGRGGRNQELALAAALELEDRAGVSILSLATDGRDGPTDAAGAIVDGSTAGRARAAGIDPAAALQHHDSYRALDAAGVLVRTGPTGTNVNDVMLALVD